MVLASLFTSINAQLRVLSDGRVQAGQNVPSLDQGKVATLLVLGSNDKIGTGAIIALGDFGTKSKNTFWGEYGNTDSDQLWFQGKLGYYLTYGEQASSVVSYYDPAKNSNFVFNTNLRVNGVNITSDARMKDNIQPIENPIDVLSRVDGVSYTYRLSEVQKNRKSEENAFPETSETMANEVNEALTEKELRDEQIKKEIEESLKQMQQTIQDQQKEIETLQSFLPAETKSMFRSTSNEEVSVVEGAKLYNRAGASVSYTLPATYNTADLKVFDISGKLLKKIVLTGNNSIVDLNSSEIENLNESLVNQPRIINTLSFSDISEVINAVKKSAAEITIFTSGTTGQPKKVLHSISSLTRSVRTGERYANQIWGYAYAPTHMAGLQVFFQAFENENTLVNIFGRRFTDVYPIIT